jgi:hypothetical protein
MLDFGNCGVESVKPNSILNVRSGVNSCKGRWSGVGVRRDKAALFQWVRDPPG